MQLPSLKEFIAARDFLMRAHDYKEAKAGFVWPELADFNWARDYFDKLADHCTHPALIMLMTKKLRRKSAFKS